MFDPIPERNANTDNALVQRDKKENKMSKMKVMKQIQMSKYIYLLFIMDLTGSMSCWINAMKDHIKEIIKYTKRSFNKEIFVGFQGYRDYCDKNNQFESFPFSSDVDKMI